MSHVAAVSHMSAMVCQPTLVGNGCHRWLAKKIVAFPDQTRTGILLVSLWLGLIVTGSPCSRRTPDIGRLTQTFRGPAPFGPTWLEPGVYGQTLDPSGCLTVRIGRTFRDVDHVCDSGYHW